MSGEALRFFFSRFGELHFLKDSMRDAKEPHFAACFHGALPPDTRDL